MEKKFTPGPWKVHHYSHINEEQWLGVLNGAFDLTHNGAGNPAVIACSKYSAMTDEENLANANLISAAPELLVALEYAVRFRNCVVEGNDTRSMSNELKYIMEQAIRKAYGES
jgi:hypothetical protein